MADSVVTMFDELRAQRPPVYDADRFRSWVLAVREVVQALPRFDQRWASVALVANDLVDRMPGSPFWMAFGWLARNVLSGDDLAQITAMQGRVVRKAVQP